MSGGPFAWILVFGGIAFFVWLGIMWNKKKAEYMSEGKMVKREKDFMEYGEIFTLHPVPLQEVKQAIQGEEFKQLLGKSKLTWSDNGVAFAIGTPVQTMYTAKLICLEYSQERSVYRFDFEQWRTSYGVASAADGMNLLLTAIERMFLNFDPNTQVSTVKNPTRRG